MVLSQIRHAREAATALKELVQRLHVALCVTHGNGPQVGLLALQVPTWHQSFKTPAGAHNLASLSL